MKENLHTYQRPVVSRVKTIKFVPENLTYELSDLLEITEEGIYYPVVDDQDNSILKIFISNDKLKQFKEKLNGL